MKRTLIGGAVLSASLLLGAGPALACGHPGHGHKPSGHHKPHHGTHKPKPAHHHHGKPCACHKPKPPRPKPHPKPPVHGHHKPPTHIPGHGHHQPAPKPHKPTRHVKPPTARVVTHRATPTAQLVSVSTPASLPRTGGTPWVLIYAGGAFLLAGSAIRLALPLRKASERAS